MIHHCSGAKNNDSEISNRTGKLVLEGKDSVHIRNQAQTADYIHCQASNGQVALNYISGSTGSQRLETNSSGVKIDGELLVTDDITAFYSSDKRLKDNITPIEDPLAKVLSISGNTFNWNEASKHEGKADTGVIAQEIEALGLPGLPTVREDGTHAVNYEKLTALLIEAVKELSAKVDALSDK